MSPSFYEITWTDVSVSLLFVVICLVLVRWWKVGLEKTLLVGSLRTFVQLSVMGYVLTFLFQQQHWGFMVGLVAAMIIVASYEGTRRQKETPIPHLFAILSGTLLVTVFTVLGTIMGFILEVRPWYYPYVMIPIAGMIIGNALNSMTITLNRFAAELVHREQEIEMMLALGAPARVAVEDCLRESIKASLLPSINALMMVGLVQLPGVMTGQILSGVDPLIAVRYQIMIMYMWLATATIADIVVLALVFRQFFTPRHQIRKGLLRKD